MINIDLNDCKLTLSDGVFTLKNINTTIGFVRFNENGEVEYIFVNPIFRKKGIATKLLKMVKDKTGKTESDVIKLMRKSLKPSSFRLWRKRVHNTSIKHRKKFKLGRKKLREKIKITDIY